MRNLKFSEGEWYHCYGRGVDKRTVFESKTDYERYLELLYLSNSDKVARRSDLLNLSHAEILTHSRGNPIVAVGSFTLMPNHQHLLLKEITPGGISKFVGKVNNAYTKYFNLKNKRNGNLFVNPFSAKHVPDDRYFKHLVRYILLNAVELFEPGWKYGRVKDIEKLGQQLLSYPYASVQELWGAQRSETAILDQASLELFTTDLLPLPELLEETAAYFKQVAAMSTPGVD